MTDYRDSRSVAALGCEMIDLTDRQKAAIASFLVDEGLMVPADWTSKFIWLSVRMIAKVREMRDVARVLVTDILHAAEAVNRNWDEEASRSTWEG